jgi:sugar lactone lactonase YvrE
MPGAVITRDGFSLPGIDVYPEGIAVDEDGNFFVGSLGTGSIYRVSLADGSLTTPFDTADLVGVVGLTVHESGLWACHSNPTVPDVAQVIGFDLENGEELVRHNFPSTDATLTDGSGFCNDLAFDADGNLYATDSFGDSAENAAGTRASRLIRVPADDLMTANSAETWLEDPGFEVPDDAFGLNGIAAADGTLYVARAAGGLIYEVPIETDGSPGAPAAITTSVTLEQADGMELLDDTTLLLVQQSTLTQVNLTSGEVTLLTGAALSSEFLTTFAIYGSAAWIVEGQLDHYLGFDPSPPMLPFRVVRVALP